MEHLKIWARAREEIRPQMTGLSFHAWIDSLVPLVYKNNILVLEVPNPDILKTLKDFYFEMLFQAARKAEDSVADVLLVRRRIAISMSSTRTPSRSTCMR